MNGNSLGHDIHVWVVEAVITTHNLIPRSFLESYLPEVERKEAFRYQRSEEGRMRFLVRRVARRLILQKYTGIPAKEIAIERDVISGNPMLRGAQRSICFSCSSSEAVAVIAVTHGRSLGVDVEKTNVLPEKEMLRLVGNFFTKSEYRYVLDASFSSSNQERFYKIWTLKEAWLKATGRSLAQPLDSFSISLDDPSRLLNAGGGEMHSRSWRFGTFVPQDGYVGAIAYEYNSQVCRIIINHLQSEDLLQSINDSYVKYAC